MQLVSGQKNIKTLVFKMNRRLGIVLIIIGFAVSINPYWILFAIPIFIVGSIVLWTTSRTIFQKALWTIVPLLIWYPSMNLFLYANAELGKWNAQKIDFIFPDKFYGRVVIVTNCPCGQGIQKNGQREQIIIPENGILLYKGKIKTGYMDYNYYTKDSSDNKKLIPRLADHMFSDEIQNETSSKLIGVFPGEMGSVSNFIGGKNYQYLALTITSYDSLETFREFKYLETFRESVDSVVANCQ